MCNPVAVVAVAATAATIWQQQSAANQEEEYQDMILGRTTELANAAALEELTAIRARQSQETARAAQAVRQVTAAAKSATATARIEALETGTRGNTVDILIRDFERVEAEARGAQVRNLEFIRRQLRAEERSVEIRRKNRILAAQGRPILGPLDSGAGVLASGLSLASAGLGAASSSPQV